MADLRILDGQVLDQGMYQQDWTPEALAAVARAGGFEDLWNSGYTAATGDPTNTLFDSDYRQASYSPELLSKLGEYNFYRTGQRPGETDRGRHLVATDASGNPVYNSTYSYSKWTDAPIEAAKYLGGAYLGASALNGGLLGMGGPAPTGGLAFSGQMPVEAVGSMSGLPAIAGVDSGMTGAGALASGASAAGSGAAAAGTAAAGGGLLGSLGKIAPGAAQWIAANPMLAKGLFSLGTGLLASAGGGGGGGKEPTFGPAKKWNSSLQQGLIGNPQLTDIAKPVSFKGRWS